jgi:hypothetical protein
MLPNEFKVGIIIIFLVYYCYSSSSIFIAGALQRVLRMCPAVIRIAGANQRATPPPRHKVLDNGERKASLECVCRPFVDKKLKKASH